MKTRMLAVVCTLMTMTGASAATRTWTGAAGSLWSNPGNWAEGAAPVAGDTLVLPAGAANLTNQNDLQADMSFTSLSFDDDYVVSGNALSLTGGLNTTAQADINLGIRINVQQVQTWSFLGPTATVDVAWLNFPGGSSDPSTLTLYVSQDLRLGIAGRGTVDHTGGGHRKVTVRTVGYWESMVRQIHQVNDGRLTFTDGNYRIVGHTVTVNGTSDDGVTFVTGSAYPLLIGPLTATGGMVEVSTARDPVPYTYAGELTLGPNVVFQAAVSPFVSGNPYVSSPLTIGQPPWSGYSVDGSRTVYLNDAALSVIPTAPFPACMARTLIDNDGTDAVVGTFAGLPEGAAFTTASGEQFRISYVGGTGNDVTITAIDEGPETCGAVHADLNGDRRSDVMWRHTATGEDRLWRMNGLAVPAQQTINTVDDLNWQIAGLGDFNGDGKSDVFWRHAISGENYLYLMDGATIVAAGTVSVVNPHYWEVGAIGDFDGDGKSDIVWRTRYTGENYLYLMDGLTIREAWYIEDVADTYWKIVAAGDLNNDGRDDLVWYNTLSGGVYGWLMDGFDTIGRGAIADVPDMDWKIVAVRDFDSDGHADLFWRNEATGETYLYRMDGTTIVERGPIDTVGDLDWKAVAAGDYNGDGRADVLWRHASSGETYVWLMDGLTIRDRGFLPLVEDLGWTPIP